MSNTTNTQEAIVIVDGNKPVPAAFQIAVGQDFVFARQFPNRVRPRIAVSQNTSNSALKLLCSPKRHARSLKWVVTAAVSFT